MIVTRNAETLHDHRKYCLELIFWVKVDSIFVQMLVQGSWPYSLHIFHKLTYFKPNIFDLEVDEGIQGV